MLVRTYISPGVFLTSRVTGACPVTTDLIIRVNVKTATTTATTTTLFRYGLERPVIFRIEIIWMGFVWLGWRFIFGKVRK